LGQREKAMMERPGPKREERSMSPFVCRFAVGRDKLRYSSVWRVWTRKNKPDLNIAVRDLVREFKARVHGPHPKHTEWARILGFDKNAASIVSQGAKRHGGPHKLRWTGCKIGPDTTIEYRVRIGGTSLEEIGQPVADNVELLPIPSRINIWKCTLSWVLRGQSKTILARETERHTCSVKGACPMTTKSGLSTVSSQIR
jgi:hypothetical protein